MFKGVRLREPVNNYQIFKGTYSEINSELLNANVVLRIISIISKWDKIIDEEGNKLIFLPQFWFDLRNQVSHDDNHNI